jgi:WD40 repeat protein
MTDSTSLGGGRPASDTASVSAPPPEPVSVTPVGEVTSPAVSGPSAAAPSASEPGSVPSVLIDGVVSVTRLSPDTALRSVGTAAAPTQTGPLSRIGDYELLEEIARGGMGMVWKARQVRADRVVALKLMLPGAAADAEEVRRFRTEAEAAARMDHPNILPVYEVGQDAGRPFFSMRLAAGGSLRAKLTELVGDPRRAAALMAKVADAIHHAHQRGVLHRDLKPANILLDEAGEPMVADFGLARRTGADAADGPTRTGQVLGTPAYMAPEQAAGDARHLTVAADVWGLGAILFATLTGRPPFQADSEWNIIERVMREDPPRPRSLNPRVDRDLETICLKCLEKSPDRRYRSAADLAADLRRWLAGEPIRARPVGPLARTAKWARRHPALAGLVATAALAVVMTVVAGALLLRSYREQLSQARLDAARRYRAAGESLCGEQRAARGLLHLVRALELVGDGGDGPQDGEESWAIRRDIGRAMAAIHPLRAVLLHDGPIRRVDYSPDGTRIVTAGGDGVARLWDAATGRPVGEPMRHEPGTAVTWVAYRQPRDDQSPRAGPIVATGGTDRTARLWDGATAGPIGGPIRHPAAVTGLALSPDGRTLCTGDADGTARLWDVATGAPRGPPMAHTRGTAVRYIAFSPEGDALLTAGVDGLAQMWDAAGRRLHEFRHGAEVHTVAFGPMLDGIPTVLTVSADRTAAVWDRRTGRRIAEMRHHEEAHSMGPSAARGGEPLLATGGGRTVQLWDLRTGFPRGTPMLHDAQIDSLRPSPSGDLLASGGFDSTVRLWDAATQAPVGEIMRHQGPVRAVRFVGEGVVVSGSEDGTARLWDVGPRPDRGDVGASPDRLRLWLAVHTGLELDDADRIVPLTAAAWRERLARLLETGGLAEP